MRDRVIDVLKGEGVHIIHYGDSPTAVTMARLVRARLEAAGIKIAAFAAP